jgi:predicted phage terminase large subunit-like protein
MVATREDKIRYLKARKERLRRDAKVSLLAFAKWNMATFEANWFHEMYYDMLTRFANGEIKRLMVFVPPQHGKSQGSTRFLPAFMLGQDPRKKIAIVSYSAPKARKFNREIQRVIDTTEYHQIFPDTTLNASNVTTVAGSWLRNADECETVGFGGGFKTVGVGGPLTGEPVDILIMDDIYKDAKTAWSETVRDSIQDWYGTVADTRLHNNSQQLIVFTRWHEKDLAGYLLSKEGRVEDGGDWTVITFPAIKVGPPNEYDPRHEGEALWPERHGLEKLEKSRERDNHIFESLYQQNPKPKEGLLYKQFKTYRELPPSAKTVKAVIDTADTGSDYLCSIVYCPTPTGYYLRDVIYTSKGMEDTEPLTARQLTKWAVSRVKVESNNGGRSFARSVEKMCRQDLGNHTTAFSWYHQTNNKEVRIFTRAAEVQNMIYYPEGWDLLWPDFYNAVTGYMAQGKNKHDDAPDTLTMLIEEESKSKTQNLKDLYPL